MCIHECVYMTVYSGMCIHECVHMIVYSWLCIHECVYSSSIIYKLPPRPVLNPSLIHSNALYNA